MKNLLTVKTLVLSAAFLSFGAIADCPDTKFACPTGEQFTMGSHFVFEHLQCETNGSILGKAMSDCPNHCGSDWSKRADGCSIPVPGLDEMWNEVFHGACDLHDLCYSSSGHSQTNCDVWLLNNMLATCRLPGIGSALYGVCVESAKVIFDAVSIAGKSSFDSGQKWANSHCTRTN
jgi:hypothetical protein